MADHLQQLLDFLNETRVINRLCQFDVSKMARTFSHILIAGRAFELSVDRSKARVVESLVPRLCLALIHGLGVEDMADAHVLDFLGRKQSKLDLLDDAQRRIRVHEVEIRHDGGWMGVRDGVASKGEDGGNEVSGSQWRYLQIAPRRVASRRQGRRQGKAMECDKETLMLSRWQAPKAAKGARPIGNLSFPTV